MRKLNADISDLKGKAALKVAAPVPEPDWCAEGDGLLLACMDDGLLSREWESLLGQPTMTAVQAEFFQSLSRTMAFRFWRRATDPKREGS
jgi:hypothetical protein